MNAPRPPQTTASAPDGRPLTARVRAALERMILNGEIAAGERLNELAVATRLEVSRGPVREAVRALEEAGLVRVVRNKGVFVRRIALEEALDLYDIRGGLARAAGRLLAERATSQALAEIRDIHERMGAAATARDVFGYYELNIAFHAALMAATRNSRLAELDARIRNQLQLYLRRGVIGATQMRLSHTEHGRIVEAIAEGNGEKAGRMFEAHVLSGKQRTLINLSDRPDDDR